MPQYHVAARSNTFIAGMVSWDLVFFIHNIRYIRKPDWEHHPHPHSHMPGASHVFVPFFSIKVICEVT